MSTIDEIKTEMKAMEERKNAYMASQKDALTGALRAFLEKHDKVKAIVWTQYTPYFNDGEPCEFSVNDPEVIFKRGVLADGADGEDDDGGEDYDEEGGGMGDWSIGYAIEKGRIKDGPEIRAIVADLKALESAIAGLDDLFLHAFGDHSRVKVTRRAVSVDEYSHD